MNRSSTKGLTIIEVAIALAVFTGLALLTALALQTSLRSGGESFRRSIALSAARDLLAQVQEAANADLSTVYTTYHGLTQAVPGLEDGLAGFTCYKDEAAVPAELGGPQDLNMDGDDDDDTLPQDLKLVPMRLVLTWTEQGTTGRTTQTLRLHVLLNSTTSLN